jgi:hypothetical protein
MWIHALTCYGPLLGMLAVAAVPVRAQLPPEAQTEDFTQVYEVKG